MSSSECRWGIMSSAQIARKNYQAIYHAGNARLIAVASRERAQAEDFIESCQKQSPFEVPPRAVEGYQALIDDPEIDAVYIPLPGLRKEWVLKAARAEACSAKSHVVLPRGILRK